MLSGFTCRNGTKDEDAGRQIAAVAVCVSVFFNIEHNRNKLSKIHQEEHDKNNNCSDIFSLAELPFVFLVSAGVPHCY